MTNLQNKKLIILITGLTVAALFGLVKAIVPVRAAVNPLLNFVGKVTNIDGTEVADGNYDFSFALYTQPTGGGAIWSEDLTASSSFAGQISNAAVQANGIRYTYTGATATGTIRIGQYLTDSDTNEAALIIDYDTSADTVTVASGSPAWSDGDNINNRPFVEGGVININLGSVTDIAAVDFNQTLYLEVVFNTETMQPRKIITTVAAAFQAARLGDKTADELAALADSETITGQWSFNNILNVATTSANTALTVTQNGSGNIAEFKQGATTSFAILADGRVQIGNYRFPTTYGSPGYVLKTNISGDLYWGMDISGTSGGIGLWATSSDGLYIYQADTARVVVLGDVVTASPYHAQFEVRGSSWFDTIGISDQNPLRFYDADSSNYFAFRATTTLASDLVLTLPGGIGTPGQALLTDGTGNLYWGAPSGTVYVNPGVAGQLPYFETSGNALSGTSSLFISSEGYFGIGTATPSAILSVGGIAGSQFLVNADGQIIAGTWQGGIIGTAYGGTGTSTGWWTGIPFVSSGVWAPTTTLNTAYGGTGYSSYTEGDILYGNAAGSLSRLPIGSESELLVVGPAGTPIWVSTTSLNIDAGSMTGILDTAHGGTGQNLSSDSGFIYLDNGLASASSTIRIPYTDLAASAGIILAGNMLTLDDSGDWGGTFDTYEAADFFTLNDWYSTSTDALEEGTVNRYYNTLLFAADLFGTTTDALRQGATNLYWSDSLFDARFITSLAGTSSLPNLTTLAGLTTVGTISSGVWEGTEIDVAHGGTGLNSVNNQSILYASSDNVIAEFTIGNNGEVLSVVGNQLQWSSTTAPVAHGILSVYHSDTEATGTLIRGDLLVADNNGKWNRLALGPAGYILYSDGNDAVWATTTSITSLGTIVAGVWEGTPIDIAHGGTGATTATGARANLGLTDIERFGINSTGTVGWLWQSDGDGRGHWVATGTLGIGNSGVGHYSGFIGTTTAVSDGSFTFAAYQGYQAANAICDSEFSGSHFCRTYDIIRTIEKEDISGWAGTSTAWIAEGPPGYQANSNDCLGWTDGTTDFLGAYWKFSVYGGGAGWLIHCGTELPLACCFDQ